jgi:hypothetical protein
LYNFAFLVGETRSNYTGPQSVGLVNPVHLEEHAQRHCSALFTGGPVQGGDLVLREGFEAEAID